jgi:folate-binding Fe-S cluster repair protein YgfZ
VVPIAYDDFAPDAGAQVNAGDKVVGALGSTSAGRGLAMLRLDRVADALASGTALETGGVPIRIVKPAWARFPWPGEKADA